MCVIYWTFDPKKFIFFEDLPYVVFREFFLRVVLFRIVSCQMCGVFSPPV